MGNKINTRDEYVYVTNFPPSEIKRIVTFDELDERRRRSTERRLCMMPLCMKFLKIYLNVNNAVKCSIDVWNEILDSGLFSACVGREFFKRLNKALSEIKYNYNLVQMVLKENENTGEKIYFFNIRYIRRPSTPKKRQYMFMVVEWPLDNTNNKCPVRKYYWGYRDEIKKRIDDWFERGYRKWFLSTFGITDEIRYSYHFTKTRRDLQKRSEWKQQYKQKEDSLSDFFVKDHKCDVFSKPDEGFIINDDECEMELLREEIDFELKVYKIGTAPCVRISDIENEKIRDEFQTWMIGKTKIISPDHSMEEQDFCYVWDWDKYVELKKTNCDETSTELD